MQSSQTNSSSSRTERNSGSRHYSDLKSEAKCRPAVFWCALSCLLTVGITNGAEVSAIGLSMVPGQAVKPVGQRVGIRIPVGNPVTFPGLVPTQQPPVPVRSATLSASRSTITGFADAESLTAAYYWSMTLKNTGSTSQEAVMQLELPEGAVVSRATLWVNGVAQEAAFSSTLRVTSAYEWVKNGRNVPRAIADPLVITQTAPGRILVKASPVNPGGQEMRIQIGFTSPLSFAQNGHTTLELPHIISSNFGMERAQDVHIESQTLMTTESKNSQVDPEGNGFLLKGNIAPESFANFEVGVDRTTASKVFAARATHSPSGTYILATVRKDKAGKETLSLEKVTQKPSCQIIDSEPVAHRLSTLWAYSQIEELMNTGDYATAEHLANVYRVVSSVSGATVLEMDSDYSMTGLNRDMYSTIDFNGVKPQVAAQKRRSRRLSAPSMGGAGGIGLSYSSGVAEPSARPMPAPETVTRQAPVPVAPSAGFTSAPRPVPTPSGSPDAFDKRVQISVTDSLAQTNGEEEFGEAQPIQMAMVSSPDVVGNAQPESGHDLTSPVLETLAKHKGELLLLLAGLVLFLHGILNKATIMRLGARIELSPLTRIIAGGASILAALAMFALLK